MLSRKMKKIFRSRFFKYLRKFRYIFLAGLSGWIIIAANSYFGAQNLEEVKVFFEGNNKVSLIGEDYIRELIQADLRLEGIPLKNLDLYKTERILDNNSYIENAEVYLKNKTLIVRVKSREPIVRIYYKKKIFYWDKEGNILPPSDLVSPNVPVVLPHFEMEEDSVEEKVREYILPLLSFITLNPFWNAYVSVIEIQKDSSVVLYPTIGKVRVFLGKISSKDIFRKMQVLDVFNREILNKKGWNSYKKMRVDIKNQIIAIKEGDL